MNKFLMGALLFAGGSAVYMIAGAEKPKSTYMGLPTDKRFRVEPWVAGKGGINYSGLAYFFDGKPIGPDPEVIKSMLAYLTPPFNIRRGKLPKDARPVAGDKYSKEAYAWPYYHSYAGFGVPPSATQVIIDEYGRIYDIDYSQSNMWSNLWANPLFQAAVIAALVASGYGIPAYAALQAYQMRGSELTLENVALQAARAYVVGYCGPACGAAFDLGVGIASGKSYDEAAEDALLGALSPEERQAYEQGKTAAKDAGVI